MEIRLRFHLKGVPRVLLGLTFMLVAGAVPGRAQTALTPAMSGSGFFIAIKDYFLDWFPRVTRIQSEQPHWVTRIVTVTPRLEEEFRYDQFWQGHQYGQATDNFGGSKGLELIPFQNTEIILGVPAWIAHNGRIQHATKKSSQLQTAGPMKPS